MHSLTHSRPPWRSLRLLATSTRWRLSSTPTKTMGQTCRSPRGELRRARALLPNPLGVQAPLAPTRTSIPNVLAINQSMFGKSFPQELVAYSLGRGRTEKTDRQDLACCILTVRLRNAAQRAGQCER